MDEILILSEENMKYEVNVIRVFTHEKVPTLGNPAGVVVMPEMLSEPEMKEIAVTAGQPMTAFLSLHDSVSPKDNDYDLRYYDLGGRECHICGHATLAATADLVRRMPSLDGQDILFRLNPGLFEGQEKSLTTHVRGKDFSIDLFPSKLRYETDPALHKKIASVLGVQTSDIDTMAFSVNIRDYVVAMKNSQVLIDMKPNFQEMKEMAETGTYAHEGLMVSALAPKGKNADLYVRVFLPITGVNEDIACGSGNCSIIPLWHDKGLNTESKYYRTIFPFPEGKKGYVGGVQSVKYIPSQERITIEARTTFENAINVTTLCAGRNSKPTINAFVL